ncbi:MAG: DUF4249 family protein [Rhodothermales bacterium]|nr:DUF4249 family protein [Rhodothermales bacterium]
MPTSQYLSEQGLLVCAMLILALTALALAGCDESVNPFVESDRIYSVYGSLDMNADTQYVRVIPIDTSLIVREQGAIDASVSSTDINTNKRVQWNDSLFVFRDGSRGHVFYAPLRIEPEHTYRLEFVRSDGQASVAETTVPGIPSASIAEPRRLVFSSGAVEVTQNVLWSGVERAPAVIEMWYRFSGSPRSSFTDIRFEYPTDDRATAEPGWTVVVQLSEDRNKILENLRPENYLFLGVGMRLVILDDQFVPPGGIFDPEILSQPGAFSNVDNGFGFVGSVGRFDVEWVLDAETATALQFVLPKAHD